MSVFGNAAVWTAVAWLVMASPLALATEQTDFSDVWLSEKGDGAIEIKPCGVHLCGYVHSIFSHPDPSLPLRDNRNEKPELRKRPLCGLQIIGALKKVGSDAWGDGWVYDPETGKRYSAEITLQGRSTLAIRGYMGVKLMGKTVQWSRAKSTPQKCVPLKDA